MPDNSPGWSEPRERNPGTASHPEVRQRREPVLTAEANERVMDALREQIGQHFGITKERVRESNVRGMKQLREWAAKENVEAP